MKEDLHKLDNLHKELENLLEQESELYKKAMDNGENKIKIKSRQKPKKKFKGLVTVQPPEFDEVKEKWLWEEIRLQGTSPKVEAVRILSNKYPELFKVVRERESKNLELNKHLEDAFDINPMQMSIPKLIKLIEKIVEYKVKK